MVETHAATATVALVEKVELAVVVVVTVGAEEQVAVDMAAAEEAASRATHGRGPSGFSPLE